MGYEDAVKEIEAAIKKDGGDGNDDGNADSSVPELDVGFISTRTKRDEYNLRFSDI